MPTPTDAAEQDMFDDVLPHIAQETAGESLRAHATMPPARASHIVDLDMAQAQACIAASFRESLFFSDDGDLIEPDIQAYAVDSNGDRIQGFVSIRLRISMPD